MANTALRAEKNDSCTITFKNKEHEKFYMEYNLTYAMEHGEEDAYLDSRKLNIDCKNAIQEVISNNFDGMHLNHDVVNPVLEEYGAERLSFVLACTLQEKSWEKDWPAYICVRSAAFEAGRNSKAQWEACDTDEYGRGYGA